MPSKNHQLVRIVFAGLNDIEEWRLGNAELAAAKAYPRDYPAPQFDDHGIVFVDITLDAKSGRPVCHEINGPNAVGSDALTADSSPRAQSEATQAIQRAREMGFLLPDGRLQRPVVTLHAHQHWRAFRTGGEFYPRVDHFANLLEQHLPGNEVCRRGAAEALGGERLSVVMGDVPAVAVDLVLNRDHHFEYQGRPVIFIGNPNLLPELVRTRKLAYDDERLRGGALRVFHGWRLVSIVHDKAKQQQLLEGTTIQPLRHFAAHSAREALAQTRQLLWHGSVVLKPHATSGGTGIHVVGPHMTDGEIQERIDAVLADCNRKYGANAEATLFPIRGFEFVRSTGYPMPDGDHLWDLRIAVLFEPGKASVFPVSMRIAPLPFDEQAFYQDRDRWVSNVSGRQVTLLKSGMDEEALAAVGMTADKLEEVFLACVAWTVKAWEQAKQGGHGEGTVYEDDCERADKSFYPRDKFLATNHAGLSPGAATPPIATLPPSQNGKPAKKTVDIRYPVLPIFVQRWSPRSFSTRQPEPDKLRSLFEAARLAPSAHNSQPARFLIVRKQQADEYQRLFQCLSEGNQLWAHTAPVLVLASGMRQRFNQDASKYVPYPHFMHDLGLAVMSLILQAQAQGLHCHPMAGFDPDKAREAYAIPELFEPAVVIAIGYLGSPDDLPEQLKSRELGPRVRKPLEDVVFEGAWGQTSSLFEP